MRYTVVDLKTQLDTTLANNTSGLISAQDVRDGMQSILDSITVVTALTTGNNPAGVSVPGVSTTPAPLPATFYTTEGSGDATLLEARNNPDGDLLVKTVIGLLQVAFNVTIETANGTDIGFTLTQNGATVAMAVVISGRGTGNPISATGSWLFTSLAVNDTFELVMYTLTGTATVTLFSAGLKGILLPEYQA
jgi:hypothetical protein